MRVVLQRVSRASVRVDGSEIGAIGSGLVLLVGFAAGDGASEIAWMTEKVVGLRVFSDEAGKMNRSVLECGGSILVVSQFTLYGDARKGRRPSFIEAARSEIAIPLYGSFVMALRGMGLRVATGEFGADMQVELVNDGPVTLILDKAAGVDAAPGLP
jgi:D-tyrosyl-tRNA(Tyr) deacylase